MNQFSPASFFTLFFVALLFLYLTYGRSLVFKGAIARKYERVFPLLEKVVVFLIAIVGLASFILTLSFLMRA